MVNTVICLKTSKAQEYWNLVKGPEKLKWNMGIPIDTEHLFKGMCYIKGNNTSFFIHSNKFPQGAKVTYNRIIYEISPQNK